MMQKRLPSHLIIGDCHAHDDYDNDRFEAVGNFIVEAHPDVVIQIGDFADMPSLSSYDKGKKSFEGRRYERDCAATIDAQERLWAPLNKAPHRGLRPWSPRKIMTTGNHDGEGAGRIGRFQNDSPEMAGKVSIDDLGYRRFGWEVYDFLTPVTIDGVTYCHYFSSGISGRPISGESIGKTLCNKLHTSAVQGHSHLYDHSERSLPTGKKIFGITCGCLTHPEMIETWSKSFVQMWWRGIVMLRDLDGEGYYDSLQTITLRKLMRDYI
jgi:hypothetical protein